VPENAAINRPRKPSLPALAGMAADSIDR